MRFFSRSCRFFYVFKRTSACACFQSIRQQILKLFKVFTHCAFFFRHTKLCNGAFHPFPHTHEDIAVFQKQPIQRAFILCHILTDEVRKHFRCRLVVLRQLRIIPIKDGATFRSCPCILTKTPSFVNSVILHFPYKPCKK